ncbi:hypothetical protein AAVH_41488, partial [Aphelenchoides avenae]
MGRSFLILLLIFSVAEAAPNTTGPRKHPPDPDVDEIVKQVDQFLQSYHSFRRIPFELSGFGFEKLENAKADNFNVTEFSEMLGDLFTNGTIGHLEEK